MPKSDKLTREDVIGKGDRMLSSIGLLTVTVVKPKYLDQVNIYREDTLPESIAIAGVYERGGFYNILFGYGEHGLKIGRIDLFTYAMKILKAEQPDLFKRPETSNPIKQEKQYKAENDAIKARANKLREVLPQLFLG